MVSISKGDVNKKWKGIKNVCKKQNFWNLQLNTRAVNKNPQLDITQFKELSVIGLH